MNFKTTPFYYRIKYYYRKIFVLFFICPDCFSILNMATSGKKFCPWCGKTK